MLTGGPNCKDIQLKVSQSKTAASCFCTVCYSVSDSTFCTGVTALVLETERDIGVCVRACAYN